MKKLIPLSLIILSPFALFAQDVYVLPDGTSVSRQFFEIPTTILAFCLVGLFILTILRWILDFRLKSKLMSKEVPEALIHQLIQPEKKDSKSQAIKWFFIFLGTGIGLLIIKFSMPIGLHSIAILSISVALGFLAYYYFIKNSEKKNIS